jgi:hypothetical protein
MLQVVRTYSYLIYDDLMQVQVHHYTHAHHRVQHTLLLKHVGTALHHTQYDTAQLTSQQCMIHTCSTQLSIMNMMINHTVTHAN